MSKKNTQPLEGPGRHSGRKHPVAEQVKDAKPHKNARANAVAAQVKSNSTGVRLVP